MIDAAWKGQTDIAASLIANGADMDIQGEDGRTALIVAAANGHTDIAASLIAEGADIHI